ncbi:hypothetical protein [Nocardioides cynanchi]|uniref:hypothetical protein n=1 Tax=Nocardioides cynanchi TaxID=2558918 RepID=UPI00124576C8|nr:hypothetical protein [Nocardioides cynanchi]
MCRPVRCRVCGHTTWSGCGRHVAQVKATVPAAEWCGGRHTPEERAAAGGGGWFARVLGR